MKEKLLLVGAGGFGRVVLEHASSIYDCAFLDDGDVTVVDDVPVIGKTSEMASFYPEYQLLLVTIGNMIIYIVTASIFTYIPQLMSRAGIKMLLGSIPIVIMDTILLIPISAILILLALLAEKIIEKIKLGKVLLCGEIYSMGELRETFSGTYLFLFLLVF